MSLTPGGQGTYNIVTSIGGPGEVLSLPHGCRVGDRCGGRTFSDNVASALEKRSFQGWREVDLDGVQWTVIELER